MSEEKLYYRIGEVAKMFNVSTSLIRYWESEFSVLRPRKSTKGNRMFTQRDLRYLHMIYQLVKVQGHTLQGAKEALKKEEELRKEISNIINFTKLLNIILYKSKKINLIFLILCRSQKIYIFEKNFLTEP